MIVHDLDVSRVFIARHIAPRSKGMHTTISVGETFSENVCSWDFIYIYITYVINITIYIGEGEGEGRRDIMQREERDIEGIVVVSRCNEVRTACVH